MMKPIISVENLGKRYRVHQRSGDAPTSFREVLASLPRTLLKGGRRKALADFWALHDVSFDIMPGERVGIIGHNGAGKSTLLKLLSRITEPTRGRITMRGRVASLLEVGTGFHPELTGRENIFLNGAILGMAKIEVQKKFDEIVDFAGVEKFLDTPVKRYSSGMYVRLGFAVAAHLEPDILIVDEVLAVGDVNFQKKCMEKMEDVSLGQGRTILFVSHNMAAVKRLCGSAIFLQDGKFVCQDNPELIIQKYLTQGMSEREGEGTRRDLHGLFSNLREIKPISAWIDGVSIVSGTFSTEHPIVYNIKYEVTEPVLVGTSLVLHTDSGDVLLTSLSNHEKKWHGKRRSPGVYVSSCTIPPNLLADSVYFISLVIWVGHFEKACIESSILKFTTRSEGLVKGDYPFEHSHTQLMPLFQWNVVKGDDEGI